MPAAIPLIAAAGSIFAGATAVAGAATLAGAIAGGVMIAGGAMTAIGAISGNKKLMKIGGLVSLAGGIGGLAVGAWAAAGSSLASDASSAASVAAEPMAAGQAASGAATGAAQGAAEQVAQIGIDPGGIAAAPATTVPAGSAAGQTAQEAFRATELAQGGAQSAAQSAGAQEAFRASELAQNVAPPATPGNWTKTLNDVSSWMERNKALTQVGGGIVQGLAKSYADQASYAEQLRMQQAELARRRAEFSAGIVGLRMPTYVAPAKG